MRETIIFSWAFDDGNNVDDDDEDDDAFNSFNRCARKIKEKNKVKIETHYIFFLAFYTLCLS